MKLMYAMAIQQVADGYVAVSVGEIVSFSARRSRN